MDPKNQATEQSPSSTSVPIGQGFSSAFGAPLPTQNPMSPSSSVENKEPQGNPATSSFSTPPSEQTPEVPEAPVPSSSTPPLTSELTPPVEDPTLSGKGPASPADGPVVSSAVPGGMPPVKKNRSMVIAGLIVFLVLIGLVLVGLVFYQNYMKQFTAPPIEEVVQPTATPTVTVTASPSGTLESGDSALDQQGKAVDENLNQLQQDVTDADKSASDTPDTLQ